jgi:diguanylate cyclase (GGDEF)-like protein/putative nucleotidyltransferase with HDIG domain
LAGAILLWASLLKIKPENLLFLAVLCIVAILTTIFKVEGTTVRSHYSINFVVYGFTLFLLGIPETFAVITISNLAEWIWHKERWYTRFFNTACYIVVIQASSLVYSLINPTGSLQSMQAVVGIVTAMAVFTLLNHLMVGVIIWLARGQNFTESGIFDMLPLIIDLTLLCLGASLVVVWQYNPYAVLIFLIPLYLIYSTLRVPALERQTEIDPKTGLFNHSFFERQFDDELKRANRYDRPLTVIMADLDLLRNINNTYGHLAGDEVLIGVAKIIKQNVREYDIVARFGGEEYSILMPETTVEQAYERANSIRHMVEQAMFPIPTSVTPIRATLSLGVAGRENFAQNAKEIIHNADTALYYSKLKGRNRVFGYLNETFVYYSENAQLVEILPEENPLPVESGPKNYSAAQSHFVKPETGSQPAEKSTPEEPAKLFEKPSQQASIEPKSTPLTDTDAGQTAPAEPAWKVNLFIILLTILSGALFLLTYHPGSDVDWLGKLLFVAIVVLTELFSIDLYVRDTAVSTSAAPMIAGFILFGPLGILILALVFALTAWFKFRGPGSRVLFNASNQLIAGSLVTGLIWLSGGTFQEMPRWLEILICLGAAFIVYWSTTLLITVGMTLKTRLPFWETWKEHFSWLLPYYLTMGLVAYALIFGYESAGLLGTVVILVPLMVVRVAQKQYVDRTRSIVNELREKNRRLEKSADEISKLNEGLLETLSEVIDMRDPYVLGHSRQVTHYAVEVAKALGLNPKQIDLIRKASLLHDVGKLGIPENILSKPARLTRDEYAIMKKHAELGAILLEKTSALRPLIPIVKYHHEFYNGNGYPEGHKGHEIPIEARIVAVADAIEAMASDRPYRKALATPQIIDELLKHSGMQFDPQIVEIAVRLLQNEVLDIKKVIVRRKLFDLV